MAARPEPEIPSLRAVISRELQQVAIEHGRTLAPLADELKLFESGLDSLGLAIVIARLEEALGVDPFAEGESIESPVKFGDFVRMYKRVLLRIA
jgi:acyl carrier protein